MLFKLLQIDSLNVASDKVIVGDWVNILTVIVVGFVFIGGVLLLRNYLVSKRK